MDERKIAHKRNNGAWGGVILIVVGLFLFLQNIDLEGVPGWVFSWQMLMVVIGLLIGIKHRFRGGPWFILTLLGAIFLVDRMGIWQFDFPRYGWPLGLVLIGIFMLIKRPYRKDRCFGRAGQHRWSAGTYKGSWSAGEYKGTWSADAPEGAVQPNPNSDDFLSVSSIFGGTERVVLTKNFQGGDVSAIFGGVEINLTQADFNGQVVIETNAVFGGIELVVPSNWDVKLEVDTIFGGVEDKRPAELVTPNTGKILVIKGSCVFGGMEIKSYA
ncbi:LiaF transmembrane domain-containing protein [Chitinophaga japonensis]|uniref:Cell wall-active antibiotic response 4TMS protein YvqF n=1 Tax=Chitinophaga japonensis TaxID=104662 RepID=A0A562SJR1_CHIJA|nr:LiaF domain-containing protein [Chitinophaga japonensis]TWI81030.1 cell wall-active antibiotic response 4TMS protein YvqF [Chitinophaga japonensis]